MNRFFISLFLYLSTLFLSHLTAQSINYKHNANRVDNLTNLSLKEGKLSFKSEEVGDAFIVIESKKPLILKNTIGAAAKLLPGLWQERLGDSLILN